MEKLDLLNQFGVYTFNKKKMEERLPPLVYKNYLASLDSDKELSKEDIKTISEEMKKWALELGATHYTHWFSSLNGLSAEKHEAFLEPKGTDVYYKFDEEALLRGESDASSFPNGGLRSTYKAGGYTLWDPTSISFIKDNTLYIPSFFFSYNGEALDYKTHLSKSNEALNQSIKKLYKLFGININKVDAYVGVEQEYFLISEELYNKRLDLKITGRTLFGKNVVKEQEDAKHYYAPIDKKVGDFMKELDRELWKYGIPSKSKHNEASPNQFEVVCVYRKVNTTSDNNLLLMQIIKEIAKKHKLRCLLHEKPFDGINGSGKHNNYSLITDEGLNLLDSSNLENNLPFLCLLACFIRGIDEFSDLLSLGFCSYSNELRLGGNEAPPSIISICLGNKINRVINDLIGEKNETIKEDVLDRNRTSPIAFIGNRFEFRGLGSSQSVSLINTIINSILAYEINIFIEEVSKGNETKELIKLYFKNHKRIIFEGDGYSSFWKEEAKRRGLKKQDTLSMINSLMDLNQIKPFIEEDIFTKIEIESLHQILLEEYFKEMKIEINSFLQIIKKEIIPSLLAYLKELLILKDELIKNKLENLYIGNEIKRINEEISKIYSKIKKIENAIKIINKKEETLINKVKKYKEELISEMDKLREIVDNIEDSIDKNNWPLPTYTDLLFSL